MSITLKIKTDDEELKALYANHGYFHAGDIGIDLFCPEETLTYDVANQMLASNLLSYSSPPRFSERKPFIIDFNIVCEIVENIFHHTDVIGKKALITTRNIPYMLVPRSSIIKTPLIMANSIGIIDAGYRNTLKAAVYNFSNDTEKFVIQKHSRLFQIVLFGGQVISKIEVVDTLSETERGKKGFGSTGV